MSLSSAPIPRPVVVHGGPGRDELLIFANASVHGGVGMTLYMNAPDDDVVALVFGDERFRLEFTDVESLERLRDLADEGVRRLRVAAELNARATTAGVA